MARQRDYRAEYARRVARAKERGQTAREAAGHKRNAGTRPDRRQVFDTPNGRMVKSTKTGAGLGVIRGQLAGHGTDPARLVIKLKDGSRRTVYGRGRSARAVADDIAAGLAGAAAAANAVPHYSGEITADDIAEVSVELLDGYQ